MSIPYTNKVNEQSAVPVTNESHIIGILGTVTYSPGKIRLVQVPQGPGPAVTIPGYVEILTGTPSGNQFIVNYTTGVITFDASLSGTTVLVSLYQGLGSEIAAEDVNELQNPVSSLINQSVVYNWPSAPTVTWSLAAGVVSDANVSNTAAISLTKLQPLGASIVPVTNGSGILVSSSVTAVTLSYLDATSSIQTQLNGKQATGSYITALTGDVSATGPGSASSIVNTVGGSTAANVHSAELAANAATSLDTVSTIVKRDGSGNFLASIITATGLTLTNEGPVVFQDTQLTPNAVTLEAPTTITASYTLKWPAAQALPSTFLQNDGSGNLSWVTAGSGGTPGGSNGDLQYNFGGTFGGTANITTDGTTITFVTPTGNNIEFLDTVHATIGADGTANHLLLFGPTQINLSTSNSAGMFLVDNGSQVQVTTNPSGIPDPTAVLDISTTAFGNLGFLPPKMTTSVRNSISTPATGLLVYDTNLNQWMGYNGTSWVILG
ncbi:MAG: hypothetical protein ACREBR_05560 [bacterium]